MNKKEKAIILFFNDESDLAYEYIKALETNDTLAEEQEDMFKGLVKWDAIEYDEDKDDIVKYGNKEYLVLTDREADDKLDEILDDYIDFELDIPKHLRYYFNDEDWKSDAKNEGRGSWLAGYDHIENYVNIDDQYIYFYRTN